MRQHRFDGSRHVHRVSAASRRQVERVILADEGTHVGDVDIDPGARTAEILGGDRVVEVLRARRIDREGGQLREVAPAAALEVACPFARLGLDVVLEAARQPAVEQQRLNDVAGNVGAADDPLDDGAAPASTDAQQDYLAGRGVRRVLLHGQAPQSPLLAREQRRCRQEPAGALE